MDSRKYYRLHIQGIQVDTQGDVITVKISLRRPGLLIGSRGKDIDAVTKELTKVFGVETKILIDEIRKDINEPFICY
jgi:ribosomal protein S3